MFLSKEEKNDESDNYNAGLKAKIAGFSESKGYCLRPELVGLLRCTVVLLLLLGRYFCTILKTKFLCKNTLDFQELLPLKEFVQLAE